MSDGRDNGSNQGLPDPENEDLKAWARRMAENAPPLTEDQILVIIAVFASALRGERDE
jgi:hypothetical protein